MPDVEEPEGEIVDPETLGDDTLEEDYYSQMFKAEIAEAKRVEDGTMVKQCQLAALKQLDTYKVPAEMIDEKTGKAINAERVLYNICEAKGILHSFHNASRLFSRRVVKFTHSVPIWRLLEYGWQPSYSHTDMAGIVNASGLYSFTVGVPQIFFAVAFTLTPEPGRAPAPCEVNPARQCTMLEDFGQPIVQKQIITLSLWISVISLIFSITNLMIDIPALLFEASEKEEEMLHMSHAAEQATKTWEDKLSLEVQENVKRLLKLRADEFEDSTVPGMEVPGGIVEEVMLLEKRSMMKKIAYIEHYINIAEDESKVMAAMAAGMRRKERSDEVDSDDEDYHETEEDIERRIENEKTAAIERTLSRKPSAPALPPPAPLPPPKAASQKLKVVAEEP